MPHPREPFNVRGEAEQALITAKAERVEQRTLERQERLRPVRVAHEIEALHKREQPGTTLDMLPRDRVAEIKVKAERQVDRKEARELAKVFKARDNMVRQTAQMQAKAPDKAQLGERGKAQLEKMEQAARERREQGLKREFRQARDRD